MGKEIIRFHAVYWPAFLMAADLPLPRQIWAHGWLLFDSEKMSKSRGNVVRPRPIVNVLGIEPLRYYLLREIVFGQDGSFSYDALVGRYNSDLANGLGNLASRTLTMIERYFGGEIPPPAKSGTGYASGTADFASEVLTRIPQLYDRLAFSLALEAIWEQVAAIDKYLTVEKPWTLAEKPEDKERLATVLYTAAEGLRIITALAHPVLPQSTQKIWQQLGQPDPLGSIQLDQLSWEQLKPGTKIGKLESIFPRVEKSEAIERIEAMEQEQNKAQAEAPAATPAAAPAAAAAAAPAVAAPAKIGIDDFTKVEMRVGQVKSAERVPGADRLLQLQVDIGDEVRQIVAGIALAYKPEDLVGRKVVVVTNLQPRKLRGVESNGMILAASNARWLTCAWLGSWKMFPWDRDSSSVYDPLFVAPAFGSRAGPTSDVALKADATRDGINLTKPMDLIDSHAHVDVSDFDDDREAMLERARAAGVGTLLAIGNGPEIEKLGAAVAYADKYDWIYAAMGIHPHEARHATDAHYAEMNRLARHPKVIAWGEIGLDYHYDHSPRDIQAQVFRRQLDQARAAKRPAIIHCREAWADCLKILDEHWRSCGLGGIFHCFTGTIEEARQGMDMGFLVSFAGNVTYPKAQNLRDVAREIPLDRMLVETDSPFLAPQGQRGRRNEPANVAEVARTIANVRNLPADEVARATSENFRRFFGLTQSSARSSEASGGMPSQF